MENIGGTLPEFFSDAKEEESSKCAKVMLGSDALQCDSRQSSKNKIFQIIITARGLQNIKSKIKASLYPSSVPALASGGLSNPYCQVNTNPVTESPPLKKN